HEASLFTLDKGVVPVFVSSLQCKNCGSTYHLNYCRQQDPDGVERRHYYAGRPKVLQVETHVLIDSTVATLFKAQALHSQPQLTPCNSASALAIMRIYNSALSKESELPPTSQRPISLRNEYIWDTFYLDALLQHHDEQHTTLVLLEHIPGNGRIQKDRLTHALEERNRFMEGTGQEYYAHACDGCVRVTENDGHFTTIHAAITDGVAVGRPCCGVHNCHQPLPSIKARFCNQHQSRAGICSIQECNNPVRPSTLTCHIPEHMEAEHAHQEKGKSMFTLARRLLKHVSIDPVGTGLPGFESLAELIANEDSSCDNKSPEGNRRAKARFGRSWTHNEQLIVRPCGVIVARATFYGAEAISSVADMLRAVFPTLNSVPDILFYDNNCHLRRHLHAHNDTHFTNMGLPVDIFHYKTKHSEKDEYCGQHCNPLLFPDIYDVKTKTWFFNSSAAEQTNVWFNGYHSIVHDMMGPRFDFFLDEMIKERNRFLVASLEKEGKNPHLIPTEWLFQ
ncbi:hypothetical protein CALCODRAFT_425601, partial [Calocera cornea HHB12733]